MPEVRLKILVQLRDGVLIVGNYGVLGIQTTILHHQVGQHGVALHDTTYATDERERGNERLGNSSVRLHEAPMKTVPNLLEREVLPRKGLVKCSHVIVSRTGSVGHRLRLKTRHDRDKLGSVSQARGELVAQHSEVSFTEVLAQARVRLAHRRVVHLRNKVLHTLERGASPNVARLLEQPTLEGHHLLLVGAVRFLHRGVVVLLSLDLLRRALGSTRATR
mmetsp:Transcript_21991/g.68465  ORF Transcript_21991/g.68465 Transcript_21991/m.68465 type:complete len:220 (+) Transcript_21991:4785-5444(+)